MKRIEKFGSLSVNQKLSVLKDKLGEDEILLFQYYEIGDNSNVSQEDIDETFEYYCDDIIYYYNSDTKLKIEKEILKELVKESKNEEMAQKLFLQIKKTKRISSSINISLDNIKKIVFHGIEKYNIDLQEYNYVLDRLYERSKWILDEEGKRIDEIGAIWYQPKNQEEYLTILKSFPLFSCISIRNGEALNNFSYGYVIQETAEDYDLLIYKNEECKIVLKNKQINNCLKER